MRALRYSINVTLDGRCDHRAIAADEELHRHAVENLKRADALLFGRVTYEMMEAAFRPPAATGARPDWMDPFAQTIDAAKKYVVSSTLDRVDWNAELVRGDLKTAVQRLKREPGKGLFVGGVKLPLAELGLIDEYEFVASLTLTAATAKSRLVAVRDAFIATLYRENYARTPSSNDLTTWSRRLKSGASLNDVALSIWASPEHRTLVKNGTLPQIPFQRTLTNARRAAQQVARTQRHGQPVIVTVKNQGS